MKRQRGRSLRSHAYCTGRPLALANIDSTMTQAFSLRVLTAASGQHCVESIRAAPHFVILTGRPNISSARTAALSGDGASADRDQRLARRHGRC
jgi:hypothetical protein